MTERAYKVMTRYENWKIVEWEGLEGGDTGQAYELNRYGDISIHVKGTFNGRTLSIQGDNDYSGTATWPTLNDPQGNALEFTAEKIEQLLENVCKIRPSVSAGAGASLSVFMKIQT